MFKKSRIHLFLFYNFLVAIFNAHGMQNPHKPHPFLKTIENLPFQDAIKEYAAVPLQAKTSLLNQAKSNEIIAYITLLLAVPNDIQDQILWHTCRTKPPHTMPFCTMLEHAVRTNKTSEKLHSMMQHHYQQNKMLYNKQAISPLLTQKDNDQLFALSIQELSSLIFTLKNIEHGTLCIHTSNTEIMRAIKNLPEIFTLFHRDNSCILIKPDKKNTLSNTFFGDLDALAPSSFFCVLAYLYLKKPKVFFAVTAAGCTLAYILQLFSTTQKTHSLAHIAQLCKKMKF